MPRLSCPQLLPALKDITCTCHLSRDRRTHIFTFSHDSSSCQQCTVSMYVFVSCESNACQLTAVHVSVIWQQCMSKCTLQQCIYLVLRDSCSFSGVTSHQRLSSCYIKLSMSLCNVTAVYVFLSIDSCVCFVSRDSRAFVCKVTAVHVLFKLTAVQIIVSRGSYACSRVKAQLYVLVS